MGGECVGGKGEEGCEARQPGSYLLPESACRSSPSDRPMLRKVEMGGTGLEGDKIYEISHVKSAQCPSSNPLTK